MYCRPQTHIDALEARGSSARSTFPPAIDLLGRVFRLPISPDEPLIIKRTGAVLRNGTLLLPAGCGIVITGEHVVVHARCPCQASSKGWAHAGPWIARRSTWAAGRCFLKMVMALHIYAA